MAEYLEATVDKFIFRVATDRLYSPSGVWVKPLEDQHQLLRLDLTDYVQQRNGDVAFVHIQPAGTQLCAGEELAEVETAKATVSFFSPVSGRLAEINAELKRSPEEINEDPYGKGWLAVIEASAGDEDRAKLLNPSAYLAVVRSEAEQELNGA